MKIMVMMLVSFRSSLRMGAIGIEAGEMGVEVRVAMTMVKADREDAENEARMVMNRT